MSDVIHPKTNAKHIPTPDAVARERADKARWFVATVLACVITLFALYGWYRMDARFATEARLTYVLQTLDGRWAIKEDMNTDVLYFESTLNNILYDFIERRYSKRSETIVDDWAVAYAMYSPQMRNWFANEFRGSAIANEHAQCRNCLQTRVRVRTHQHLDELPRHIGKAATPPVRTLIYATSSDYPPGSQKPTKEVRQIYRVTWRLLSKASIQSNPDLLRYDPIGVEIIDVTVTDDTTD